MQILRNTFFLHLLLILSTNEQRMVSNNNAPEVTKEMKCLWTTGMIFMIMYKFEFWNSTSYWDFNHVRFRKGRHLTKKFDALPGPYQLLLFSFSVLISQCNWLFLQPLNDPLKSTESFSIRKENKWEKDTKACWYTDKVNCS